MLLYPTAKISDLELMSKLLTKEQISELLEQHGISDSK